MCHLYNFNIQIYVRINDIWLSARTGKGDAVMRHILIIKYHFLLQLTVAPDGHSAHAYVSDRNNIEK